MHHYIASTLLMTLLWLGFHALKADALAIAAPESIFTTANQTKSLSTLTLTLPDDRRNQTLTPLQSFIPYRVPRSSTTLQFHSFGLTMPTDDLLRAAAMAVVIAYDYVAERKGRTPIVEGYFKYKHEFLNLDVVVIAVGDFREVGRPMTNNVLCDVLRGIGEFVLTRVRDGYGAQEMHFEVEGKDVGYVGTGHVEWRKAASPTSSAV